MNSDWESLNDTLEEQLRRQLIENPVLESSASKSFCGTVLYGTNPDLGPDCWHWICFR